MTNKVLEMCAKELMVTEGGYVNDPRDPGGETKYGISKKAYPNEDIKNMTQERAIYLFKRDYWDKCKCDNMPDALSIVVSDCAYNSGTSRANKILQECLGVTVDGIIGPKTLGAIQNQDLQKLIWKYHDNRLSFLKSLSTWEVYGNGWKDRVDKIHDLAAKYI